MELHAAQALVEPVEDVAAPRTREELRYAVLLLLLRLVAYNFDANSKAPASA